MQPWFTFHRASDSPRELAAALDSPADLLELDVWAERGRIALRHDPLLAGIPFLTHQHGLLPRPRLRRFWLDTALANGLPCRRVFLDIKDPNPAAVDLLVDILSGHPDAAQIAASTPHWRQLDRLAQRIPTATLLYSIGRGEDGDDAWARYLQRIDDGTAGAGVSIHYSSASAERLRLLNDAGLRALCYTVNDERTGHDLLDAGAGGLTSDRSDLIAAWRDRWGSRD